MLGKDHRSLTLDSTNLPISRKARLHTSHSLVDVRNVKLIAMSEDHVILILDGSSRFSLRGWTGSTKDLLDLEKCDTLFERMD